jgi:2,3-dihydroxyphenylpropionate 1,2-dioxygenase
MTARSNDNFYVACVPHVPLLSIMEKQHSPDFWRAYDDRVAEFDAFAPDLVIVFGVDHYSNIHLNLAPTFMVGFAAEAINDNGGVPGKLDVPMDISIALSHRLMEVGFDIATSYAMKVDHGFSNVLGFFLHGHLDAVPVIPIHINMLSEPRPSLKRCRQLGEAVGQWAAGLGKRIAFLGSGGLSHSPVSHFPQYHQAPTEEIRRFLVHGGTPDGISEERWHADIKQRLDGFAAKLLDGTGKEAIIPAWDEEFLRVLGGNDFSAFDHWTDKDIVAGGGSGAGEVRSWLAAVAAGKAAGGGKLVIDYYSDSARIGVGAGIVHAPA